MIQTTIFHKSRYFILLTYYSKLTISCDVDNLFRQRQKSPIEWSLVYLRLPTLSKTDYFLKR